MNIVINTHYCQVTMSLKYCWEKSKTGPLFYRRTIPKDIREALIQRGEEVGKYHVVSLGTRDVGKATKLIASLAKKDDKEWERLRNGILPTSRYEAGLSYLEQFGLSETKEFTLEDEVHEDLFIESLKTLVPEGEPIEGYLNDAQVSALDIRQGRYRPTLSDAKVEYLRTRPNPTRQQKNTLNASFDLVTKHLGDAYIERIKRRDVSKIIEACLSEGVKTGTIDRKLGVVRAAIKELLFYHEMDGELRNPFREYKIPNLGKDVEKGRTLTIEQQKKLRAFVLSRDGVTANIVGLLVDTGARVGEMAGLRVADVKLDAPIPYLHIVPYEERTLKTKASSRMVPLMGLSLMAAKRAVESAVGLYLFPRYASDAGVKNNAASQAVNKALASIDCGTTKCMRHTMSHRLKSVNVPKPRRDEIQGWARQSHAEYYGDQSTLQAMAEDIAKTL